MQAPSDRLAAGLPELRVDPLTGLRLLLAADAPILTDGAVAPPPDPMLAHGANPGRDLFWRAAAAGVDEAVPFASGSAAEVGASLDEWRERIRAHAGAACVHVGADDGAGRLYALPFVPQLVAREREHFGAYATRTMGGNLLADLVQEEVRRRERIVAIDDEAVLIAPYGSRVAHQLLVAPRVGRPRFEDDGPTGAALLHDALRRLAAVLGDDAPLTLWVRTAPRGAEHFCWRIDVLPRPPEPPAGLELATGLACNPVTPERAAAELRELW